MPRIYKRNCDECGNYYEGLGVRFCSPACSHAAKVKDASSARQVNEDLRSYSFVGGYVLFAFDERIFSVEASRWDQICWDYSELGGGLTCAQVARKHGIPFPVLRRCLSRYGQFKASPPVLRERIADHAADLEPLVREAVENAEDVFIHKLNARRDEEWKADYKRLKAQEVADQKFLDAAVEIAAKMPPVNIMVAHRPPRDGDPWVSFVPTADEHIGKYVWSKESFGRDYDTDLACKRMVRHAHATVDWVTSQPGRCKKMVRGFLGDLFHALMGETVHETKLDQDTRSARVFDMGAEAIRESLLILLTACDELHVYGSCGNHDGREFYLFMSLVREMMEKYPNVAVHRSPGYYQTFREGDTLFCLDHGYRAGAISGWKGKAQAEVVARETAGPLFHGATHIYSFFGHLHEWEGSTLGRHHTLIREPSMGESDDFETSLRFPGDPIAHAYRLNEAGRICDTHSILPADLVEPGH